MSFTVDDFQDLLRLLEQHPEWQAELRRHVLSEELLALPALVRELAEGQLALTRQVEALAGDLAALTRQVEALTEGQLALTRRVDALAGDLAALTRRVDALAEGQLALTRQVEALAGDLAALTRRVDALAEGQLALTRQVEALTEAQARTEVRVGRLEGDVLELRYARRAPAYFARLARRLRVLDTAVLADLLDEAVDEGRLVQAERADLLLADLVLSGRRRDDGAEIYLLAELSVGVGPDDVRRAADRAALLAKLGRPVMPVVAGRSITPEAADLARSRDVSHVLNGKANPPGEP